MLIGEAKIRIAKIGDSSQPKEDGNSEESALPHDQGKGGGHPVH